MASKAIVIGCAAYRFEAIPDLRFAEKDARALHGRLVDPEIGAFDPAEVQLLIAPIHAAALISLERVLQDARPEDTLIVYFAGHGLRDERGQMYLAVADTDPNLLRATSISARYVRDLLDDCRSRRVCVILDCCFSGAFGRGQRSTLTSSDVKASLDPLEAQGTIVLTSSQASQPSLESEQHTHGTFTHYLLEGLDGGAEDAHGLITPVQLFHYVCGRMEREIGSGQRPMFIGDMSGGSFSIARSKRKRDGALASLEKEVAALVERHEHATAIERIGKFNTVNAREQELIESLRIRLRGDMERIVEEYRRQLFKEGGERIISGAVLRDADTLLSQNPEKLFRPANKRVSDKREVLLRNHLVGRINAAAMEELWPKSMIGQPKYESQPIPAHSIPAKIGGTSDPTTVQGSRHSGEQKAGPAPVTPGPVTSTRADAIAPRNAEVPVARGSGNWLRSRAALLLTLGLLLLAGAGGWIYTYTTSPGFDPRALKLGLLAKRSRPDREAERAAFAQVVIHLNERLQPHYRFVLEIRTYDKLDDVITALRNGQIDVAGELAPWDIYEANRIASAEPFISPKYNNEFSYFSNIVLPRNSRLIVWNSNAEVNEVETWSNILRNLETGSKLAVSRDQSTSGYWYPRYMVLRGFADIIKRTRPFEEVVERVDANQIPIMVACEPARVIAGAVPSFDYDKNQLQKCNETEVSLAIAFQSVPIKHGAFVMRKALANDPSLVENLKGHWQHAVHAAATKHPEHDLQTIWTRVDPAYYENAKPVFSEPEPGAQRQLVAQIATAFLLAGAFAYAWFVIRRRSVSNIDASTTEKKHTVTS